MTNATTSGARKLLLEPLCPVTVFKIMPITATITIRKTNAIPLFANLIKPSRIPSYFCWCLFWLIDHFRFFVKKISYLFIIIIPVFTRRQSIHQKRLFYHDVSLLFWLKRRVRWAGLDAAFLTRLFLFINSSFPGYFLIQQPVLPSNLLDGSDVLGDFQTPQIVSGIIF